MNAWFGKQLATLAVIKSNPGDLFREQFEIILLNSLGVKYFSGRALGKVQCK